MGELKIFEITCGFMLAVFHAVSTFFRLGKLIEFVGFNFSASHLAASARRVRRQIQLQIATLARSDDGRHTAVYIHTHTHTYTYTHYSANWT